MRLFSIVHRRHKSYSSTVLLPKTSFEQRVDPRKRYQHALDIAKVTGFESHYKWQQQRNRDKTFVLHDGPPYANGELHLGHAVNKILKDITCRYKVEAGHRVEYVPGWDCHGLPIETKAIQKGDLSDASSIRPVARKFALETVAAQMRSFENWGIMADWKNNIYKTLDTNYVKAQLHAFCDLYEKGFVFRDYKPVYWSPSNETALAEAELEYNNNHQSTSVFVKFEIDNPPSNLPKEIDSLSALIWTTTPWTLVANQAICFSKSLQYGIVREKGNSHGLIVSLDLLESLEKVLNSELCVVSKIDITEFTKDLKYKNPLVGSKLCSFIPGDHVTAEKGTGLVHSAPNHGFDDYKNAQTHGISPESCLVDEKGKYTSDVAQYVQGLKGLDVLSEGTEAVVNILKSKSALLHENNFVHSYPYDWRSKKPIIVRSSKQWFIDLSSLRNQAISALENEVEIIPESAKRMFINQLSVRPHWCISRQRTWGVPIPVFYDDEKPRVSRSFVEKLCKIIDQEGLDFWFTSEAKSKLGIEGEPGRDIMDIWVDSGISWKTVLKGKQADLYLEGGDQIRGWFQSSLLTSVALTGGRPPYKKLFLHGFTLDKKGHKMSKSQGNVISPDDIINGKKAYGIDVLRWWVASHAATSENILVKPNIIEECALEVSKLRNTYKFILGNTESLEHMVEYDQLEGLDKAILHSMCDLEKRLKESYDNMSYNRVCSQITSFVANEVSGVYMQALKNRLYCFPEDSLPRRSACTALKHLGFFLIRHTSPILPHLSAEVLQHFNMTLYKDEIPPVVDTWNNQKVADCFEIIEKCRQVLNKHAGTSASSQVVTLYLKSVQDLAVIETFQNESWSQNSSITDMLQCCKAILVVTTIMPPGSHVVTENVHLKIEKSTDFKCPRCRRNVSENQDQLCTLCEGVLLK